MRQRLLAIGLCICVLTVAVWLSRAGQDAKSAWKEVAPGVWRSGGPVAGYALVSGDKAILIDAPGDADDLAKIGVKRADRVLLTHYHRTVCAGLHAIPDGAKVQAPKKAEEWLSPQAVAKYWRDSLPLRGSRTAYLVVPVGFDNIDYALVDGMKFQWEGWDVRILDTPGHALAHVAIIAQKDKGPRVAFCGGAFASPGKLWAPYTTDWDHWTDAGLKPASKSLQKILDAEPDILCPTHGHVVAKDVPNAIKQTIAAIDEVGFLKSFERYTKERVGKAPEYKFLAKDQAMTNGSKPWTRVSEHIWLTGNTYVITSKDNTCLMIDPWDKRSADQFAKLQADEKLGPLEVVMFSHAHFDHYDGVHYLPNRDKFEAWSLDLVAAPIALPFNLRAPFIDARPVKFDRKPREGDTLPWREYRFRFTHLPGQTEFTMGVEAAIDGKRCYFTADNFFHQDMFSGSGGWMGLNRSFPPLYALSAKKVLDAAPEWVMAEHGGPFEFSAEDFRRRVDWGNASAKAADALSPSGKHQYNWNPHHVHVEPLISKAKPSAELALALVVSKDGVQREKLKVSFDGRGIVDSQSWTIDVPESELRQTFKLRVPDRIAAGRHVFTVRAVRGNELDASDAFVVVDVE